MIGEIVPRIRWSDFLHYEPVRIRLTNWKNLKMKQYGRTKFMLVESQMDYKGRKIELCVPYHKFVNKLRTMPDVRNQRLVIKGKLMIEIMKTYRYEQGGMIVKVVEEKPPE